MDLAELLEDAAAELHQRVNTFRRVKNTAEADRIEALAEGLNEHRRRVENRTWIPPLIQREMFGGKP